MQFTLQPLHQLAMNYAECEEMIYACQKAGVPLFVDYYRRELPQR